MEHILPSQPSEANPANALSQISSFQNCKTIYFCCLKHSVCCTLLICISPSKLGRLGWASHVNCTRHSILSYLVDYALCPYSSDENIDIKEIR